MKKKRQLNEKIEAVTQLIQDTGGIVFHGGPNCVLHISGQDSRAPLDGIQKWEKQLKETGNLEKKELHRSFRKIDPEKLKTRRKEREQKIARGHAEDDHEEYQSPNLSM